MIFFFLFFFDTCTTQFFLFSNNFLYDNFKTNTVIITKMLIASQNSNLWVYYYLFTHSIVAIWLVDALVLRKLMNGKEEISFTNGMTLVLRKFEYGIYLFKFWICCQVVKGLHLKIWLRHYKLAIKSSLCLNQICTWTIMKNIIFIYFCRWQLNF